MNSDGGTIYVGVKDDGTLLPIDSKRERDEMDQKVSNWMQEAFYPLPTSLIKHYFNENNILVIEVKQGKEKPYYLKEKGPKPSGVIGFC